MKRYLLLFVWLCYQLNLFAQQDAWVYLANKQNVDSSISNPISILSQKAIDRKYSHGVVIDARDVPVNETYIAQLKVATGITVMAKSKWFNAIHVRGSEIDIKNLPISFSFISHIEFADKSLNTQKKIQLKKQSKLENAFIAFNYGNTANQIQMLKGDKLHLADYTGTGVTVAVLDAGFPNVNTMASFERLREAGHVLGSYDFVNRDNDVYGNTSSNHGTLVLSTMAGFVQDKFVGTAPDADYYLFITEDGFSENPVEESYWVEAAERADSLGVDVINTSLGYTTFDNINYDYTPLDMNGNTAFISRGANMAFEKGMLLVNSAGNSGNDSWQIVGAPADASGVLSIGAVNANGNYAFFSSKGSAVQPTQKPDVVAQGFSSYVILENDFISTASGTSFSSPILAGGIVCLWQALLSLDNTQIMKLVRESASQYNTPDYFLGYGIPNLQLALLKGMALVELYDKDIDLKIYPNPAASEIYISLSPKDHVELYIFDVLGKLIIEEMLTDPKQSVNISTLSNGMYIIKLKSTTKAKIIKLIKK